MEIEEKTFESKNDEYENFEIIRTVLGSSQIGWFDTMGVLFSHVKTYSERLNKDKNKRIGK